MRKLYFYTCLFLLSTLFVFCESEDDTNIEIVDNPAGTPIIQHVEEEFKPHVSSFLAEMESRGLHLKNKKLAVVFVNNLTARNSEGFCGYGYSNFQGSGRARVEILNSENCWYRWSDIQKENLIYHELGHALLAKGHSNAYYPNGSPKSLMCSSGVCNNYRTYTKYQLDQRNYYLDQLRDSQTPMPEWAGEKLFSDNLYDEYFDDPLENWDTTTANDPSNSNRYTFFVDTNNAFSSSSLGITSKADPTSDAYAYWHKDFSVSTFDACANLKISADIMTQNLTEGNFFLVINLYDQYDENFALYFNSINNAPGKMLHENFETTAICLPQETSKIRVRLYLDTKIEASVFVDNLEIELYQ